MGLEPGIRIGPYEITGHLGTGGMGEVYRARDGNLARDVAIKVLPEAVAGDPERLARFEREAQLLASLNHPNIGGIYGLEQSDGNRCLILELIEGQTLEDLIGAGPVPLEKAASLALQMAQALESAHEKGIIHRDLKPANVKVTPDGTIKVLDFGLAKAFTDDLADGSSADAMHSPTLTMQATQAGMILGTAAYMSPEQAAGQPADRRSDIWSFGVVLLEMLTGKRAFSGESVSHTLAAVLKDDPEWDGLPDDLPPRLLELLQSCLHKKSRQRLQAIGDARIVLEAWLADPASFQPATAATAEGTPVAAPRRPVIPWLLAGVLALALVATLVMLRPEPPKPSMPVRTSLVLPDGDALFRGFGSSVVLSPDGSKLAYVAEVTRQPRRLFVRALDQWEGIRLAPDHSAYQPFFSPDGEWIGFVTRQAMFKVPVRGGSPIKLTEVALARGASWGEDGFIVYAPRPASGLMRMPDAGGEPESLTEVEDGESHRWPQVLPGGKAVLFTASDGEANDFDDARIELFIFETKERRVLHRGGTHGRFVAPGHIVFANGTSLFAAPFDPETLTMTGAIAPVLEALATNPSQGTAQFSVSNDGRLAYALEGEDDQGTRMVLVDRSGGRTAITDEYRVFRNPELSPDQKQLAVAIQAEERSDIWVYDLAGGLPTRITSGIGSHNKPVWSRDGRWILYGVSESGASRIERIAADGSGKPEILMESESDVVPTSLSPDGKRLLCRISTGGNPDLAILDVESGEHRPLVDFTSVDYDARFSPDGQWIAYGSNESGDFEVYVIPADGGTGRWQISNLGSYARWSADSRTLFYRDSVDGRVFEVPIEGGSGTIRASRARVVIDDGPYLWLNGPDNDYAVSGDGTSLLMLEMRGMDLDKHEHVHVVLDWADSL